MRDGFKRGATDRRVPPLRVVVDVNKDGGEAVKHRARNEAPSFVGAKAPTDVHKHRVCHIQKNAEGGKGMNKLKAK